MTTDLEALSREIAATSDAWMVPGVEALDDADGGWLRICQAEPDKILGVWAGQLYEWTDLPGIRPNLADPVTVNSLLGTAGKIAFIMEWIALIDKQCVTNDDRITAICRAWIAAHKEKP